MTTEYYEILGLSKGCSETEIKRAYHQLARECHPDKAINAQQASEFEARMGAISAAYNTLKDPARRAAYDKSLEKAANTPKISATGDPVVASSTDIPKTAASSSSAGAPNPTQQTVAAVNPDAKLNIAKRSFAKGMQLLLGGEAAKAVKFFEVAVQNHDKEPIYYARLAQAMLKSRRGFTKMVDAAERAIDLDPYKSEYRLILAEIYQTAKMPNKEIAVYKDILKWDPENQKALSRLRELEPAPRVSIWKKLFGK